MQLLDGNQLASSLRETWKEKVKVFEEKQGQKVCLAVIIVGENKASQVYVRNKQRACDQMGIASKTYAFAEDTSLEELLACIEQLNQDEGVHGILCQLPLPRHLNEASILSAILPEKDVDGFHPINRGYLASGEVEKALVPCTPQGVLALLDLHYGVTNETLEGKHVCVIGRSNIVGRPLVHLLEQRNATVTLCHSKTVDLPKHTTQADVLIVATGKAKWITDRYLKDGAVVIDVGINRTEDGLCGDVDAVSCQNKAQALSPVPGGVGPMTITYLLYNTIKAAYLQKGERF